MEDVRIIFEQHVAKIAILKDDRANKFNKKQQAQLWHKAWTFYEKYIVLFQWLS